MTHPNDSTGPSDYRCKECHQMALYGSDHATSCSRYPTPAVLLFIEPNAQN